jgi:hypothetical protein
MTRSKIVLSFVSAAALAAAALWLAPQAIDAARLLDGQDDPVVLADDIVNRTFTAATAEREMSAALAAGDVDLARSFQELARDRGIALDPALATRLTDLEAKQATASHQTGSFVRGFVTGVPDDMAGLAGTAAGDLFVFGDIRDVIREGYRYAHGEEVDKLLLGLAGAGIAVTAGTYVSAGAAAPARAGLSVVKAARKVGGLTPRLVSAMRVAGKDGAVRLVRDAGAIQAKAGTRAAFDALKLAETPKEMSRLATLAAAKGGKTRAIVKLAGRAALMLSVSAFNLFMWLAWAVFALVGFCASVKRTAERATERYCHRRKLRRARAAAQLAASTSTPALLAA